MYRTDRPKDLSFVPAMKRRLPSPPSARTFQNEMANILTPKVLRRGLEFSIIASLLKPFWSKPPELSTVNGGIRLVLPPCASAALQAATKNGRIVTDFQAKGKVTDQEVNGRIGGGGSRLLLRTVNGTIELKRGV